VPTIVDSLILELGLDPSKFDKGSKAAILSLGKTKDAAVSAGKQIEVSGNVAAESINKLTREVGALFALFLGGRGVKEFVSQITTANAALGRFASNLGEIPQTVAEWEMAAERMGGTASDTAGTFERLGQALYDLHRNGKLLPKEFSQLQALTGVRIDPDHGVNKFLLDTAAALQKLNAIDPAQAHFLARGMGIDDATANVMIRYGAAIGSYLGTLKQLAPTQEEIKNSQALQQSWVGLMQSATSLGNAIQNDLLPVVRPLLDAMAKWLQDNQALISSKVSEEVSKLADALKNVDWNQITSGMGSFAQGAEAVASAISQVVDGIKYLANLNEDSKNWGVTKFLNGLAGNQVGGPATSTPSAGRGNVGGGGTGTVNVIPGIHSKNARASGGPVSGGDSYLVGERGPEIFRPGTGGTIIPNGGIGGGDTKVDGKPVNKSNPMPVTLQDSSGSGGGGSWLDNLISAGKNFLGTGSGGGSGGGKGSKGGGAVDVGSFEGKPSAGGRTSAKEFMDFLVTKHGWTPAAAAIAAAQVNAESSFNPKAERLNDAGPGLPSEGLGQWNRNRLAALKKFGGANWQDKNVQMEFYAREAEKMLPGWKHTADLSKAGEIGKAYEGYRGPIQPARAAHAAAYLRAYSAGGSMPIGAGHAAKLSTIQNTHSVTTSSTSNELHIGHIQVNAPNATDANGVAAGIHDALRRQQIAATANSGPQ